MNFVLELGSIDVSAAVAKRSPELCQLVRHLSNTWNFDWSRPVGVIVREIPCQLFNGYLVQAVILFHDHVTNRLRGTVGRSSCFKFQNVLLIGL